MSEPRQYQVVWYDGFNNQFEAYSPELKSKLFDRALAKTYAQQAWKKGATRVETYEVTPTGERRLIDRRVR